MSLKNKKGYNEKLPTLLVIFLLILTANSAWLKNREFKLLEKLENEKIESFKRIFDNLDIKAKAVSIYNISEDKKIYGKNDHIKMPIASLAKITTVLVSQEKRNQDLVKISKDSLNQNGDNGIFLEEEWNIKDLAKFTLVSSSNDAAMALSKIDDNFIKKMNAKAKRIGMKQAYFINPTGLESDQADNQIGAFASSEDVNTMAIFALLAYPEIFNATTLPEINLTSNSGFKHKAKNTNIILDKIPNLLLSKTGFTDKAGGSLVIIFENQNKKKIAITILGSTFNGRFTDMEKIVKIISVF